MQENDITWRSFWNGPEGGAGPIARAWNIQGWPTLYLIDHKGIIRETFVGQPDKVALENLIEQLVADAESETRRPRKTS